MDKNIFSSFFRERKMDVELNTSGFVIFQAILNYLQIFKFSGHRHLFVTIGVPKSVHLHLVKRCAEIKDK